MFPFDLSGSKPPRFQYKLCSFPLKNQTSSWARCLFVLFSIFCKDTTVSKEGNSVCAIHNSLPLICTAWFPPFSPQDWWFSIDVSLKLSAFYFFSASDLIFLHLPTYEVYAFCKRDILVPKLWSPCAGWSLNKLLLTASCAWGNSYLMCTWHTLRLLCTVPKPAIFREHPMTLRALPSGSYKRLWWKLLPFRPYNQRSDFHTLLQCSILPFIKREFNVDIWSWLCSKAS